MGNVKRCFVLFVALVSFFAQVSAQTIFERPQKQKTALEWYEEGQIYQNRQLFFLKQKGLRSMRKGFVNLTLNFRQDLSETKIQMKLLMRH